MKRSLFALGIILGLACSASAQSCYSGAYGGQQAEPFALSAQTQSYTVNVPVTVTVQAQPVAVAAPAPVAVAAPAPCMQSYGYAAPVALPFVASYGAVGYGGCNNVGFNTGFSYGHSFNRGFVGGGFNQGFVGGQRFGAVGGTGITLQARDRRGNQVIANGVNNVRIQRGLLGRINGATADANRGLLGRVSPF